MSSLFLLGTNAFGQDQERKLIDRLLRPDMELKNDAQSKKFIADRKAVNKQANISTFHVQREITPGRFSGTKKLSAPEHGTGRFPGEKCQANTNSRCEIVNVDCQLPMKLTSAVHAIHDSNRVAQSGEFTGKRPFLDHGKSQKSLYQKNKPLTIDEVRELLNKNK